MPAPNTGPARPTTLRENPRNANHGSPARCNQHLLTWLVAAAKQMSPSTLHVLDVGGGTGAIGEQVKAALGPTFGASVAWSCIDVVPSARCSWFNGVALPRANASFDLVLLNYVLHHAADATIPLLQEARRVSRHTIVVQEDLKADTPSGHHSQSLHLGCSTDPSDPHPCTFRGREEWMHLFSLLGFRLREEYTPSRFCMAELGYVVPRGLYILSSSAHHARGRGGAARGVAAAASLPATPADQGRRGGVGGMHSRMSPGKCRSP